MNSPASAPDEAPLPRAKTPLGTGFEPFLGVVWALIVVAIGVVGVRDALVSSGALSGRGWGEQAAANLDNRSPQVWIVPVGAALAVVGLLLIVAGLRHRPRKGIRLTATTGVYLSTGSVQRLAQAAASNVDGVDMTAVSATRRRVSIDATTLVTEPEETRRRIEAAVGGRLSALDTPPTIRARVQRAEGLT